MDLTPKEDAVVTNGSSEELKVKKKRVSRACDQCHLSRVKCDGNQPCENCTNIRTDCAYSREMKKRGKVPSAVKRRKSDTPDHIEKSSKLPSPVRMSRQSTDQRTSHDHSNLAPALPLILPAPSALEMRPQLPMHNTQLSNSAVGPHIMDFRQTHTPSQTPPLMSHQHSMQSQGSQRQLPILPFDATSTLTSHSSPIFGRSQSNFGLSPSKSLANDWPEPLADLNHITVRYPILNNCMKQLPFLTPALACDMLDTYFSHSPWVKAYLVRRCSILATDPTRVRPTNPALIFAMLCCAAHSHDDPILSATPMSRSRLLQQLFELTVTTVRPLTGEETEPCLDDIMTYIQLGTILHGSEFKAIALRWWYAAFAMAREMLLYTELDGDFSEEVKEERRRTWWLLYAVDRHQGLCFHKPLNLVDIDCEDLYHPCEERLWRSDEALRPNYSRPKGISFEVSDSGLFGFFLPLMSILGKICELHHLSQGDYPIELGPFKQVITENLDTYNRSLEAYVTTVSPRAPFQYYARQIMHTLYILVACKWDPLQMLDDADGWISSDEFVTLCSHAVQAAQAVQGMLAVDPDLMFMPMLFDKLGPQSDPAVLSACEVIIRAHEVCVVTLSTEYQKKFRKVMRSMISGISASGNPYATEEESLRLMRDTKIKSREILGLYRWNKSGRGLIIV